MTGKTHQLLGLTVGVSVFVSMTEPIYNPATPGFLLVVCHFSALIPDLDRSTAKIWQFIPFGGHIGRIVDPLIKHRNISHSILGVLLFSLFLKLLLLTFPDYWAVDTYIVWVAGVVAYISHLVADMFTVDGIPLLFPIKRFFGLPPKPFEGIRIETGKWFENLIVFPAINVVLLLILLSNWLIIKSVFLK